MEKIPKVRFDAIAGYARQPQAALFGKELSYHQADGGQERWLRLSEQARGLDKWIAAG